MIKRAALAALADVVLIVIFVSIGLHAHGHHETLRNLASVSGPFLLGAVVGWCVLRTWRSPFDPMRSGAFVAVIAVAVGQVVRVIVGQGTAVAFILVSLIFLIAFLAGWRILFNVLMRPTMSRNRSRLG
ncbi:MAG: DUF3054 domain-containing protein [Acidimicrobiales bacterium]